MRDVSDRSLEHLFELDAPGPARLVDEARSAAIVAGALARAGFPPPGGGGGGGGGGSGGGGGGSGGAAAPGGDLHLAATTAATGRAAIKVAVLAGAAVTLTAVAWLAIRASRVPVPAIAPSVPALVVAPATAPVAALAPPAPPEEAPARVPQAPPPPREPPAPSRPPRSSPTRITRPAASSRSRHLEQDAPAKTAPDDLLAEANAARAVHHWRAADTLYSRVASGGQADLAVQTALVASASLHLEHLGDPRGAARRFRAALASGPGDALAEDARWGLVEAARAVADLAGERRALDDFLAHHPGSALAPRARSRRAELGAIP